MPETAVEVADVELIRKTDLLLVYRIQGREVRIPPLQVLPATTASLVGVPGTLVLRQWFAQEIGVEVKP